MSGVDTVMDQEVPPPFRLPLCHGIDLREITLDELQRYYEEEKLDAVTYVKLCLENIRRVRHSKN